MSGKTDLTTVELMLSKPQLDPLLRLLPVRMISAGVVGVRKKEDGLGSCRESVKCTLVGGIVLAKEEPMLVKKLLKELAISGGLDEE